MTHAHAVTPAPAPKRGPEREPILSAYLSRQQLADELHVTPRTVARWHAMRTGPKSIMLAGRRLYRRDAVQAWLESLQSDASAA